LAQDRHGYGNLCELITLARRRAEKGHYIAHLADVEGKTAKAPHLAGMPGCIALLLPDREATVQSLFAQAMWMKTWFPERAWLLQPRPMLIDDDLHCWTIEEVGTLTGLRIVATASPVMHTRFRKPLQDVVTAVSIGRPLTDCGFELQPNAEAYLRGRALLAETFPGKWMRETLEVVRRCTFSLEELRYEYPAELVPEGETAPSYLRKLTYAGAAKRFPLGLPEKGPRAARARAGHHRAAGVRELLPHGGGHRALGA
jgi:error-prone DNA polymerase